ncbi:hypothetical protein [Thermogymnomonas acidicola]|uniref:rhodanese-like domain-containing protein n=1 Tax=Thermogymnomonas acidicola TaxID=399579 RepID=UPI0009462144|nr:rhodanese-like domain-containing protein [Thermogymnomonas acidicola]
MSVRTVSRQELWDLMKSGNVVVVNVLSRVSYEDMHIPGGSISIPFDELENGGWRKLDKSKLIITYCHNSNCGASKRAAELIASHGYKVAAYEGGIKEWYESGMPVEGRLAGNSNAERN